MEGWDSLFDLVSWLSFWLVLMASRAVDALRGGISGSRRWRTEAGGSVQVSDLFWIRIVFRCDLLICLSIRPEIVDIFCGKLGRCGFGVGGGCTACKHTGVASGAGDGLSAGTSGSRRRRTEPGGSVEVSDLFGWL